MFTHVEVEPNPSCPMSANQVFKNLGDPFAVAQVRIFEGEPGGRLCAVTGWSSAADGTPVAAYAVAVEDSSAGAAYIVYGGDWGIRLRSADATPQWRLEDADQWGETHLVLADADDLVAAATRP